MHLNKCRNISGLLLFSFLFSCSQKKLGIKEMNEVMWDLAQVDEFSTNYLIKDSTKNIKKETLKMYQKVFLLHGINSDDFEKSMAYYKANPMEEKTMIDSFATFATRKRDERYKPVPTDTTKNKTDTSHRKYGQAQ